jgi:hypothetical protein
MPNRKIKYLWLSLRKKSAFSGENTRDVKEFYRIVFLLFK